MPSFSGHCKSSRRFVDSSTTGAVAGVPGAERECNYELDCQVCKQQMNSLNQLEQHCCRHFMKVGTYCKYC